MKRLPQLPRRAWIGVLLLLLVLTVPLAWWLRLPLRGMLLQPIIEWLWRLQNVGSMIPQGELWLGLVLLGGLNAVYFFMRRTRLRLPDPPIPRQPGRVGHWLGTLQSGRRARRFLLRRLRNLVIQIVAHGESLSREDVLIQLNSESLPIPTHLQSYLNSRRFQRSPSLGGERKGPDYLPYEMELEEIVRLLEDYLEVPHES